MFVDVRCICTVADDTPSLQVVGVQDTGRRIEHAHCGVIVCTERCIDVATHGEIQCESFKVRLLDRIVVNYDLKCLRGLASKEHEFPGRGSEIERACARG